jgi:hypothetical protein
VNITLSGGKESKKAEAETVDKHAIAKQKWKEYVKNIKPYDALSLGIVPGSRGVVITGPGNRIDYVILTAELLRATGCKLPVQFSYVKGQVSDEELKKVQ